MKPYLFFICLLGFCMNMDAQALVYKPMNPNFGGDTFGYQQLLSSADAQNDFKEDTQTGMQQKNAIGALQRKSKQSIVK
jgi:curli production assembly/transport component CsgF